MFEFEKPNIEVVEISDDNKYGRFTLEPLERGYGTTLGNSLRRIMLSSLPGAAVSQVKIAGVLHEFTTIPGVKEDVTKDEEVKEDADKKEAEEAEVLVVEPGTTYTVRFGGNIYSSPEEIASNVMYYANPGDYLTIVERLEDYWYKVSYYLAGEGIEHIGYIQIQNCRQFCRFRQGMDIHILYMENRFLYSIGIRNDFPERIFMKQMQNV